MKRLTKDLFIPHENGRCAWSGLVTYISGESPTLMLRYGRVDDSDTYDDFRDMFSRDNGETWSQPRLALQSEPVEGGRRRYSENAAIYLPTIDRLIVSTTYGFYPHNRHNWNIYWQLSINSYDPKTDVWCHHEVSDFGFPGGLANSFSFPVELSDGRVLLPTHTPAVGPNGEDTHVPGYAKRLLKAPVLILDDPKREPLTWRAGGVAEIDPELSSRGLAEPALAELRDGRVVMVARGDNGYFPDKPGCKWVCFSEDGGESWSSPEALKGDDGTLYESPASGSTIFRSIRNGRLYWIGNLMPRGDRVKGNRPRFPLVIVEVQESPFCLRMDTLTTIDDRQAEDSEAVQFSNFRYYQDRETGDVVLFMTRIGERGRAEQFHADYYRYRIQMDG